MLLRIQALVAAISVLVISKQVEVIGSMCLERICESPIQIHQCHQRRYGHVDRHEDRALMVQVAAMEGTFREHFCK